MTRPALLSLPLLAASAALAQDISAILPPGACWEVAYGPEYGLPDDNPYSPVTFLQVVVAAPELAASLGAEAAVVVLLRTDGMDGLAQEAFACEAADGRAWCGSGDGGTFELLPGEAGGLTLRGPHLMVAAGDAYAALAGDVRDSGIHDLAPLAYGECI